MNNLCELKMFYASNDTDIIPLMEEIWSYNPYNCIRILFYLRDRKHGRGMREVFYIGFIWLINNHTPIALNLLHKIPNFGYWKDLLQLLGNGIDKQIIELFANQLIIDKNSNSNISYAAKWTPNENSKYDKDYNFVSELCKCMNVSKRELRKNYLVPLRESMGIIEHAICKNKFDNIKYADVPIIALHRYRKLFIKKDTDNYLKYIKNNNITMLDKWRSGLLLNISIIDNYLNRGFDKTDIILEELWDEATKNYSNKGKGYMLPVIDISGSMRGFCIVCALASLLVYSQINNNYEWMEFGKTPIIHTINQLSPINNKLKEVLIRNTDYTSDIDQIITTGYINGFKRIVVYTDYMLNPTEFHVLNNLNIEVIFWVLGPRTPIINTYYDGRLTTIDGYDNIIFKRIAENDKINNNIYANIILNSKRLNNLLVD